MCVALGSASERLFGRETGELEKQYDELVKSLQKRG
jgi:hypothetical protein